MSLTAPRLRDISQETDQEQRRRIAEMEKDVATLDELQCMSSVSASTEYLSPDVILTAQYDTTLVKLTNAEIQIEELKMQLDDALGAEDLLVQLTERNLMLSEVSPHVLLLCASGFKCSPPLQKIEEMRITIEDLEALKELSDELEENHVETEKALQEDLGKHSRRSMQNEYFHGVYDPV